MSEEHKSRTPSLRRSSRIASMRAATTGAATTGASTTGSRRRTRSQSTRLSASTAAFVPYRPIRINIVAGDFNRPVYWPNNNEWCQSTWEMFIGRRHQLEQTDWWQQGLQNVRFDRDLGFSPVDNIFCNGATEDYQCAHIACETLDNNQQHTHMSERDLFEEFIRSAKNEQYNKQIDNPPEESNCSNHAPLFSRIRAEEGPIQGADINVLTWNVFTKGATLMASDRDRSGRGELWNAARLQARVMLTRLNFMMLSPKLNLDVVCLQEYGGDFIYNELLRPIYASRYFRNELGSQLRFIHINKIFMQLGRKPGDGFKDDFGPIPPINELRQANTIFVLINDGEPPGNIIFVRASTIDFDHIERINQNGTRHITSTVAMIKGGTQIQATLTSVHDNRDGLVNDDVLRDLLDNGGNAHGAGAGAVQKQKNKTRRKPRRRPRRLSRLLRRRRSRKPKTQRKPRRRRRRRSRKQRGQSHKKMY